MTVIDLQQCLGPTNGNGSAPALQAPAANENSKSEGTPEEDLTQKYSIAVEKIQSLYTLLVDNVGDVLLRNGLRERGCSYDPHMTLSV